MRLRALTLSLVLVWSGGCSTESTQGAAEGAAGGAVVGAVGGMVTALVFGGDVGEAAARGAVWGGSTGAVAGGMRGAEQAKRNEQARLAQEQAEIEKLKKRIGDDAYAGLEALADCKYAVAKAYADTAMQSSKQDYALAGAWVEVITLAEQEQQPEVDLSLIHI